MYTAIKATYENGTITLQEMPPTFKKTDVVVLFSNDDTVNHLSSREQGVKIGSLAGQGYQIPDDFNLPLSDLSEYM